MTILLRRLMPILMALAVAAGQQLAAPTIAHADDRLPTRTVRFETKKKVSFPAYGQTSTKVRALQLRLRSVGLLQKKHVTSYYGPVTRTAVRKIQKRSGLKQTGKVNASTWSRLVARTSRPKITLQPKSTSVRAGTKIVLKTKADHATAYRWQKHLLTPASGSPPLSRSWPMPSNTVARSTPRSSPRP